jgi:hypothetical protein
MSGRRKSHSESRWAKLPPTIVRCNATMVNGGRCKHEAESGSVVCDQHGRAAPQVRRRAAERVIKTADEAAQKLVDWMNDDEVPFGVRAKIAQDLMDRAGLVAIQVHQIVPSTTANPVMLMYQRLLSDPANLEVINENSGYDPDGEYPLPMRDQIALENVVDAEVIDAEEDRGPEPVSMENTPPKIKQLADAGAFTRKPTS